MDNQIRKQLEAYIDAHTGEMLEDIMRLCRIDSVRDTAAEGKPYGAGPYAALAEAGAICSSYGFRTAYYDNRVMTADLEDSAPCLDILAHMDFTPAIAADLKVMDAGLFREEWGGLKEILTKEKQA